MINCASLFMWLWLGGAGIAFAVVPLAQAIPRFLCYPGVEQISFIPQGFSPRVTFLAQVHLNTVTVLGQQSYLINCRHLLIFSIRRFFLGPKIVTVAWTPNLSNQPKMIMIKWSETLFLLVRLIFYILKDIRWQNCLKQLELGLTRALAENITVWLHICRDEF